MRCGNDDCPRPDESAESECLIAGYGWAQAFHEECCPKVLSGEGCLGVHAVEVDS